MTAVFITIPVSHYCEKARWALDRVALPYREAPHAPLFHRLATTKLDGGTAPVLVDGNQRFIDSTDILVYADTVQGGNLLYPRDPAARDEVEALEERFDAELGPHVRRWAYAQLLPLTALLRAALAAPMLFPAECRAAHPALDAVPAKMRDQVQRLRETVAGRFALRLYAEERGASSGSTMLHQRES